MTTLNWDTLDNWEVIHISGLYRHMITNSFGYEIHILRWLDTTDIKYANAALIVGTDKTVGGGVLFERNSVFEGTVEDCIKYAINDCNKKLLGGKL